MDKQMRISFHDQISRNKWKSFFLIFIVLIVLLVLGYIIALAAGPDYFFFIMIIAIIFTISYVLISYYKSDKIAVAAVNAKPASRDHPKLRQYHHVVEGLCLASGMPKPKLYVMQNNQINAFASGRDPKHAVICVTTGALEKLDKHELEGVIGHELSHIANYDIRFMTLTAVLVGMVAIISEIFLRSLFWRSLSGGSRDRGGGNAQAILMIIGIVLAILAPIVVMLVQLAISRKREFVADASAVKFIRTPTGLIHALKKISSDSVTQKDRKVSKAVAPLFLSDPFKKQVRGFLQTHPPLSRRIAVLEKM